MHNPLTAVSLFVCLYVSLSVTIMLYLHTISHHSTLIIITVELFDIIIKEIINHQLIIMVLGVQK